MKKNVILGIVGVLLVLGIGVSFAYFVSTSLVSGNGASITAEPGDMIKVTYDAGDAPLSGKLMPGDSVSKDFSVTVTPTATEKEAIYAIYLNITENTFVKCDDTNYNELTNACTINAEELTYTITNKDTGSTLKTGDLTGVTGKVKLLTEQKTVDAETTLNYTITITFNETNADQNHNQNKTFSGDVEVEFSELAGSEYILANYPTVLTRDTFSSTVTEETTGTIYKSLDSSQYDDDGEVYYFAGAPTDNWVKFGKYANDIYYGYYSATSGSYREYSSLAECESASSYNVNCTIGISAGSDIYWRIIRINGDGTIRLIYNGTSTSTTGTRTRISTSAFNSSYNNNMYVGYMYTSGSVHGLGTDSTIKGVLDTWYTSNLANYADDIDTNAGFCGDRTSTATNGGAPNDTGGTGTTTTYYGARYRLLTNKTPTFKCSDKANDLYTISSSSQGNKALTNPIGLITADEVAYAGGVYDTSNSSYYLYTNQYYWTMSPSHFSATNGYAFVFGVYSNGGLGHRWVYSTSGVRPVINLKADVQISGGGTISNPYVIS